MIQLPTTISYVTMRCLLRDYCAQSWNTQYIISKKMHLDNRVFFRKKIINKTLRNTQYFVSWHNGAMIYWWFFYVGSVSYQKQNFPLTFVWENNHLHITILNKLFLSKCRDAYKCNHPHKCNLTRKYNLSIPQM